MKKIVNIRKTQKKSIVKNKKKKGNNFIKWFVINLIIVSTITVIFNIPKVYAKETFKYKTVRVQSGDTVWNYAKTVINKSKQDKNISEVINDIKELNNMKNTDIKIGQDIKLPIY